MVKKWQNLMNKSGFFINVHKYLPINFGEKLKTLLRLV